MKSRSQEVFERFVPSEAVAYCDKIYNHFSFELKIKKSRQSKFGDFRFDPSRKKQTITINNDLNAYHFLITYLHEVAHLLTYQKHGHRVQPHGQEWKSNFKKVLKPTMNSKVFPQDLLAALNKHLASPKATSCSDPALYQALKRYDLNSEDELLLKAVVPGETFEFNGQLYRKIEKRRTRSVCEQIATKKKYLISEIASVRRPETD